MKYIVAYAITREYGGPEEGGWFFDRYLRLHAIRLNHRRNTNKFKKRMQRWLVDKNLVKQAHKYHKDTMGEDYEMSDDEYLKNYYSSGVEFEVYVENSLPPKVYPIERPHYE